MEEISCKVCRKWQPIQNGRSDHTKLHTHFVGHRIIGYVDVYDFSLSQLLWRKIVNVLLLASVRVVHGLDLDEEVTFHVARVCDHRFAVRVSVPGEFAREFTREFAGEFSKLVIVCGH